MLVHVGRPIGASHYAGSDCLGDGTKGVYNPADGKTYDSRSQYYNAVKAKGLVINDEMTAEKPKTHVKEINWKREVHKTINQLSPTK